MNYALIGCGRIAINHIQAAIDNNLNIVALCDISREKAEDLINRVEVLNSAKIYDSYLDMISQENLDIVAIATESGKHGKIALDCLDQGINLIIEKPIALSLREADRIVEVAQQKKLVVSACHQNRFNKAIQKTREKVEDGSFGKMMHGTAHIRWNRDKSYYDQASWRGTWEQDGGALMNQCIHNIDLLRWMLGTEISEVYGVTDNLNHSYLEAEDFGSAIVKFKNGAYGIIEGTTNIYPENLEETLYLFGTNGTVKIGGKSVNKIDEWKFSDLDDRNNTDMEDFSETPPNVYGYGHKPLYQDVIDAIEQGREPLVSAKAGRDALELILAIYLSSKTGKTVKLPLSDCNSMDFVGLFKD